jgi:phage repressor protein C with HTH and peptisase S24 domain
MSSKNSLGGRVYQRRTELNMSQKELSRRAGLTQPTISALEKGKSTRSGSIAQLAAALNVVPLWLETGLGEKELRTSDYRRVLDDGSDTEVMEFEIAILPSAGSCGGASGQANLDDLRAKIGPLIKDQRFFDRLGAKPEDVFAIIGDGDGMSGFIKHGDTVVFSKAGCDKLITGQIYAFDTVDGPRIKRVHRRADGQVILTNDNPDKNRYPDEAYTADEADALTCLGAYLYREG